MPNWLQRIAKGQMELNNETPNSAVINTVMSDDFDKNKNKDEVVKTDTQRDAEIDKRNAGILATAMSTMFPVLDFSKYGFLKGLGKVGVETTTGTVGGYLGNRGGKYLDDKFGTAFLQGMGSFVGGLSGYGLGNKAFQFHKPIVQFRKNVNNSRGAGGELNSVSEDLISDINAGKQDALDFLSSTIKKETDAHNKALAERLGYKIVQTPERARVPMERNGDSFLGGTRVENDADGIYISNKIGNSDAFGTTLVVSDRPFWDEMYIATKGRPRQTTFHEYLHRGDIGESANGDKLNTKSFFEWKSRKILNPETYSNLTYLNQPGETAANILEIGNTLNIPIGTKYPGKKEFCGIVENALSKNDPKLSLLQYYNWKNKPKRVWDGLTGRYFTLPILVAGGAYATKD